MIDIEKIIKKIIVEVSNNEKVLLEDELEKDLLIDSLTLVNIVVEIESQLNVSIQEEIFNISDGSHRLTVQSLVDFSQKKDKF